jgi:hypothetical protein
MSKVHSDGVFLLIVCREIQLLDLVNSSDVMMTPTFTVKCMILEIISVNFQWQCEDCLMHEFNESQCAACGSTNCRLKCSAVCKVDDGTYQASLVFRDFTSITALLCLHETYPNPCTDLHKIH